ncbi:unknown [Brachyspira sp. CAG:700]|nr:unknown [Brachyspira sp. CAG:700]
MTQKNKIFSITLLLLILGSVACRKSGGGGITQTDPIKNLTGNLLIVSTDGKTNLNSLPLSFVGASATIIIL